MKLSLLHIAVSLLLVQVVLAVGPLTKRGEEATDGCDWSYTIGAPNGPANWGSVCPSYDACDDNKQSPIDLGSSTKDNGDTITFSYPEEKADAQQYNSGHSLEIGLTDEKPYSIFGSLLDANDPDDYQLVQFHFHTPSEHTFNGDQTRAEVHLVHQSRKTGAFSVVAVLYEQGNASPLLASLPKPYPDADDDSSQDASSSTKIVAGIINGLLAIGADNEFISYDGSFTTPPCTEDVRFFVLATTLTASDSQLDDLEALFPPPPGGDGNARPTQPLNGRTLLLVNAKSDATEESSSFSTATGSFSFSSASSTTLSAVVLASSLALAMVNLLI